MSESMKGMSADPPAGALVRWGFEEISLLFFIAVIVVITWIGPLEWNSTSLISGYDAITYHSFLTYLVDKQGAWEKLQYTDLFQGGASIHGWLGTTPLVQLLAQWGVPAQTIINILVLNFQILFTFFGFILVKEWTRMPTSYAGDFESNILRGDKLLLLIVVTWLVGFSPLIGWRIGYGHILFLYGLLFFLVSLSLLSALMNGRISAVRLVVAFWALINAIPTNGQQMMVFGGFFCAPIFFIIIWNSTLALADKVRGLILLLWVFLSSFLVSWPKFHAMLSYLTGMDYSRGVLQHSISKSFQYVISGTTDLVDNLFWSNDVIPTNRPINKFHESNTPMPLLIPFLFLLWSGRGQRGMRWALAVIPCLLISTLFAVDFHALSLSLNRVVPLLFSFRVPSRSLIPLAALVPVFFLSQLLSRDIYGENFSASRVKLLRNVPILFLLWIAIFFIPAWAKDPLFLFVLTLLFAPPLKGILPPLFLLLVLGQLSLLSFKERLPPFEDLSRMKRFYHRLGEKIQLDHPELLFPLQRRIVGPIVEGRFAEDREINKSFYLRVPTMEGSAPVSWRFLEFVKAIYPQAESDTLYLPWNFHHFFHPQGPTFPLLLRMYNIGKIFTWNWEEKVLLSDLPLKGKGRGHWFPGKLVFLEDRSELKNHLARKSDGEFAGIFGGSSLFINEFAGDAGISKEMLSKAFPGGKMGHCPSSSLLSAKYDGDDLLLKVDILDKQCLLVLSMNFASTLQSSLDEGSKMALFPVNGPLLGMIVPQGSHGLRITSTYEVPWADKMICIVGMLMMALLILKTIKDNKQEPI